MSDRILQKMSNRLAEVFVEKGIGELSRDEKIAFRLFDHALIMAPHRPLLHMGQVEALLEKGTYQSLVFAIDSLLELLKVHPIDFHLKFGLARALFRLGRITGEIEYFYKADQLFQKAETLSVPAKLSAVDQGRFHWEWGSLWLELYARCEEPSELKKGVELLAKAQTITNQLEIGFWIAYGDALYELRKVAGSQELLWQSAEALHKALLMDEDNIHVIRQLAKIHHELFNRFATKELYILTTTLYVRGLELKKDDADFCFGHARLGIDAGKLLSEIRYVEEATDKIEHLDKLMPENPLVWGMQAECLTLVGAYYEDLSTMKQAEGILLQAMNWDPKSADLWNLYGLYKIHLGHYFQDRGLFEEAQEAFHRGIALEPRNPMLWHNLSLSYVLRANRPSQLALIDKAIACSERAVKGAGKTVPQFWNRLGEALFKKAELTQDPSFAEKALKNFEKAIFLRGGFLSSPDLDWVYNYGCALDFVSDFGDSEEGYVKAAQVLMYVVQKDDSFVEAKHALALTLMHLGEFMGDPECFYRALGLFQEITSDKYDLQDDPQVYADWGLCYMHLSQIIIEIGGEGVGSEAVVRLALMEAENRLQKAVSLGSAFVFYSLACLYSITGDNARSLLYLSKAGEFQQLPPYEDMYKDPWLEGVRTTQEFRQIFGAEKSEESNG